MTVTTKIPQMQDLTVALKKIQDIFEQLPLPGYLDGFQGWLENRTAEWEKTALRVGLVGITSAGKSTFINALAGEDILPRGARPTSGLLVVCRKAEKRNLTVTFRDHSQYEFPGDECNQLWVSRYADEAENPNNEQSVLELRLLLPKMEIPSKYELIDSPGLDAFGLEGHEELTLRTLVPLVDVVLFLTTTKSTSDRENLKALAKICKESKPVLVVQTHKDAVEPRYMKGGKILETAEQVLEKHRQRVKQLMSQTIALENAHIIQVSSIDALRSRTDNPNVAPEKLPAWEDSGFAEMVEVLNKLHDKVSQEITIRRFGLLLKEINQLLEKVKADYHQVRGKLEDAEQYKEKELKSIQDLQDALPSEEAPDFPNAVALQEDIQKVKEDFNKLIDNGEEKILENLAIEVRDKIKKLENIYFEQVDKIDSQLQKIADELAIDLEVVKPDEGQEQSSLPQLKRYENLLKVEAIEHAGFVGRAKRILGKLFKKDEWGFSQQDVTETIVDRKALREDLTEYHDLYRAKLANYLQKWSIHWGASLTKIYDALEQRRQDIKKSPLETDPEPYRNLLANLRNIRDWIENQLNDNVNKRVTLGFKAMRKTKIDRTEVTERTKANLQLALPLLQVSRTLAFTRKTHRFWYVLKQLHKADTIPNIMISTPFSQEILNYLGILGDLEAEETDIVQNILSFTIHGSSPECSLPVKIFDSFSENSRENWFLQRNNIWLFHDDLVEKEQGVECFEAMADKADVIMRVVDLHQIGHDKKRLSELPVRDKMDEGKERLAYIGMGVDRLLKGGQLADAFKSYLGLEKAPAFGLRPILLADGEDLLNSLMWLGSQLNKDTVADEIEAMEILHRTQEPYIEGREKAIRDLFHDIKEFRRDQQMQMNW